MASRKLSMSLTPELADALDRLAGRRGEDRSRLVETLLREHPLVREAVQVQRGLGTKRGRSLDEVRALAKVARHQWKRRLEQGEVRVHGPAD